MPLLPCSRCGRHARPPTCPFCGDAISAQAPLRRVGRRDFTRAAIAGSAAVLAVGCGASQDRRESGLQHEDDRRNNDPHEYRHQGGGSCEDMEIENEDGTVTVQNVCPPYGAPPAETLV